MKTEKVLSDIPDNPYILLTPGPLSTSAAVRNAMLRDWCTWDEDYSILFLYAAYICEGGDNIS